MGSVMRVEVVEGVVVETECACICTVVSEHTRTSEMAAKYILHYKCPHLQCPIYGVFIVFLISSIDRKQATGLN